MPFSLSGTIPQRSPQTESNRQPPAYGAGALPVELCGQNDRPNNSLVGAAGRNRTANHRLTGALLSRLSYGGVIACSACLVEPAGLEPAYHLLAGQVLSQLSYGPVLNHVELQSDGPKRFSRGMPNPRENTSKILVAYLYGLRIFEWSGWQDSNLRHPGSRPGTLARLSYTQSNCPGYRPYRNFA